MKNKPEKINDLPIMDPSEGIVLFHPHIARSTKGYVNSVLDTRWIGHGPKVEEFEEEFQYKYCNSHFCLAVGSGTDALHLAYLLADIGPGDEVLVPLFTCTATNIPLLYIGAKIRFLDVNPGTLNICVNDLRRKISSKTKAIVVVHYGGLPCDMDEIREVASFYSIPIIEDAAHALGAKYNNEFIGATSEFTMFSFQAIKHLTTGDGGMLSIKDKNLLRKAKRLRWFGIDREDKQKGIWENDIFEVGYKYQMTDISAAMGLAGLSEIEETLSYRRMLFKRYQQHLAHKDYCKIVGDDDSRKLHAAWLFTINVERRSALQEKLRFNRIESGQTHYRNDRYSIFNDTEDYPGMDSIQDKYLVLPLHTRMTIEDVDRICDLIDTGW